MFTSTQASIISAEADKQSSLASCSDGVLKAVPSWFAVWTRSRHEKRAAKYLDGLGVTNYLPLMTQERQWSDRTQAVDLPLFSSYMFVRIRLSGSDRLKVISTPGVVSIVGNQHGPLSVPEQQIDAIRSVLVCGENLRQEKLPSYGAIVRVIRGPLTGIKGRLLQSASGNRLIISIDAIQQSVSVTVTSGDISL